MLFSLGVGKRCVVSCANITSSNSQKRSFYRPANEIFRKIGRVAPENVTLQLIQSKCYRRLAARYVKLIIFQNIENI